MDLTHVPLGKEVIVVSCQAEGALRRRLDTMGLLPGAKITPLRTLYGGLVLQVCDGRLAINRDLASRILVA